MATLIRLGPGKGINIDQIQWWQDEDHELWIVFCGNEADEHGSLVPIARKYTGKEREMLMEYFGAQKKVNVF